jgi:hypothetical protein
MRQRLRSSLTYANVMATLAVFLVLGGGAYAAFHLPNNSVRSKHIVNGQVKKADLAASSVVGAKVRDGSLRLKDAVVGQETVRFDAASQLPTQCDVASVKGGAFSSVRPGDVALVFPDGVIDPQFAYGLRQDTLGEASFAVCNGGDNTFDAPSRAFRLIVLR